MHGEDAEILAHLSGVSVTQGVLRGPPKIPPYVAQRSALRGNVGNDYARCPA
jgi:hypothetical protein